MQLRMHHDVQHPTRSVWGALCMAGGPVATRTDHRAAV